MDKNEIKPIKWDTYSGRPASIDVIEGLEEAEKLSNDRKLRESSVEPLPITEEEYQILMPLLASYGLGLISGEEKQVLDSILGKINLEDYNSVAEAYFEIQRRARIRNHFSDINIGEMEEELFNLENPSEIENKGPSR